MKKSTQFKELSKEELVQKVKTLKKELYDMNYQRTLGTVEKPAKFKLLKHDIARIMTVLRERELQK